MGAFRPSSGRWSDRRTEDGGGGMKDFTRDRGDREKDLEKWGKVGGVQKIFYGFFMLFMIRRRLV